MRLTELRPVFLRRELRDGGEYYVGVNTIAEADGVQFLCPVCFMKNGGSRGTHSVLCWRPRIEAGVLPGPGRWEFLGSDFHDLTLKAGSDSVLLTGGCNAHFYVRNGEIVMCV